MKKKYVLYIPLIIGLMHFVLHPIKLFGMDTSIFYLDEKITLGALWTSFSAMLTGIAILLMHNTVKQRIERWGWRFIGLFFILLSLDEYFEIHEYSRNFISEIIDGFTGISFFWQLSWIFAILPFIAVVLFVFYKTAMYQKGKIQMLFLLGITCFMAILGLELVGGPMYGNHIYIAFVGLEETTEMISIAIFFLAVYERFYSKMKVLE